MTDAPPTVDAPAEWRLDPPDELAVRGLQIRMMRADVAATRKGKAAERKSAVLDEFASAFTALRDAPTPAADENAAPLDLDAILGDVTALATRITERPRAVSALIELMVFTPWPDGITWDSGARKSALDEAARDLAGLAPGDLAALTREFDAVMKQLRRKSIRWGRVAAVTVVGLGAGVMTGGMAAPAIGAAVGGTLGLSGAAATSAGLAALGGGSLAAGGFGVAGGTALVTGVSGLTAAGVAGASARYSRFGSGTLALDAVKIALAARLLAAEDADRDQKLRRIVESLQQTANHLAEKTNLLTERIAELKEQNRALSDDNNSLRAAVTRLRTELIDARADTKRLRAELEAAQRDRATVDVVLDRLPSVAAGE
ncbi:hypothetical protein IU433_04480 [Nocardia puris]|uniref:Uncharacterized protein n=1 Tax=Nocardia puris TaxID=208602 RepID=A0A366DWL1_9NOCA|nr:cell division protein ZapB [Nocardia puris]MBF6209790.1 hypothetical protein [Nocardia puris]MBF6366362.1 hypothetical protein [Nocardia puris]MBF6458299.1 hypothetical protein [Nocardia puris]RBO94473.1 hypothetical protein DFR74_102896 [Nocardia puris]